MSLGSRIRTLLLLVLILLLGARLCAQRAEAGASLPMPFGYGMSVVLSGSMEPVLSVNDLVFIRETKNVQPGDIIVYESGGSLIIHRVLSTEGGVIITKGDANNVADEPFDLAAVKGKMIGHVPGVGALIRVLKTPAGTFALMAAAVLLIDLSCRPECGQDEDIEKEEN